MKRSICYIRPLSPSWCLVYWCFIVFRIKEAEGKRWLLMAPSVRQASRTKNIHSFRYICRSESGRWKYQWLQISIFMDQIHGWLTIRLLVEVGCLLSGGNQHCSVPWKQFVIIISKWITIFTVDRRLTTLQPSTNQPGVHYQAVSLARSHIDSWTMNSISMGRKLWSWFRATVE